MSIEHAILGLLSWQPLSGYDIKKVFEDSEMLYWSGNNNQVYRTLVHLHNQGLVSREIQMQEIYPARKVYSITSKGSSELAKWVRSAPQPPEIRQTFQIQLAWAAQLDPHELDGLLAQYEEEITSRLLLCKAQTRQHPQDKELRLAFLNESLARSPREAYLWRMILENQVAFYENELNWVRKLRKEAPEV